MPRGSTPRNDVVNANRRAQMLDKWIGGATYQQIAKGMGTSRPTVYRQIQRELRERAEQRAELADVAIEMQMQRFDRILDTHMQIGTDKSDPLAAARSARIVLETIDRINRMLGLDRPTQHEVTVNTTDEIDREIAELAAKVLGKARADGVDVDLPVIEQLVADNTPPA